ncbi:MAG: hypothetical protein GC129_04900 [Proteobacteria bacterium]|nr:hypothetical protein [Pseudomonadota bacterium]
MKTAWFLHGAPLMGVALLLAACGGSPEVDPRMTLSDGQCMSIADSLKTLRKGEPLPRVVEVLGEPARTYRVIAPFGTKYDVIEYDVGGTPCARMVLNAPKKLEIVFDEHGGMLGSGRNFFTRLQRATAVRLEGVPLDTQALGN